jgi:NADPH:quinone reductase-like Zn-dependent oxidoreductase
MLQAMLLGPLISMTTGKKMGNVASKSNQKDLIILKELIDTGKIKPVIDKRYTLPEVPEALRYLGEGHARGKIVITIDSHSST